ncbi:MAG: signal recognition particle-docking protein FtsY [Candidatus Hydrogenedentes bacterium]|nr:signal recognition particle-docking protein FtsY [Candidatus Hydrogenedentota bacterium]
MATGFLGRLRDRLGKTRTALVDNVRRVLGAGIRLDDAVWEELESVLIEADLGVNTVTQILDDMRKNAREKHIDNGETLIAVLKEELTLLLSPGDHSLHLHTESGPHVTLIAGVNGSGKTTTAGKIAAKLQRDGRKVLLGAADTFRAAAAEQLTIWSERAGVDIIKHQEGADPASVAFDVTDAGISRGADNIIIDTAGRLHNKLNLMNELKKIQRVIQRRIPDAPHEVLLVLDATTGQNGLQQARVFTEALNVTGIVLTKLDGTAKGGMVVAIQKELGIPIKLIGIGEGVDDLAPFNAAEFVEALFG